MNAFFPFAICLLNSIVASVLLPIMEVFAVAANVMAAVSLTLQLVDTLENIKEFWKGMRNAPEEVKQIICDLELLEGILDGVRKAYVMFRSLILTTF